MVGTGTLVTCLWRQMVLIVAWACARHFCLTEGVACTMAFTACLCSSASPESILRQHSLFLLPLFRHCRGKRREDENRSVCRWRKTRACGLGGWHYHRTRAANIAETTALSSRGAARIWRVKPCIMHILRTRYARRWCGTVSIWFGIRTTHSDVSYIITRSGLLRKSSRAVTGANDRGAASTTYVKLRSCPDSAARAHRSII